MRSFKLGEVLQAALGRSRALPGALEFPMPLRRSHLVQQAHAGSAPCSPPNAPKGYKGACRERVEPPMAGLHQAVERPMQSATPHRHAEEHKKQERKY